MRDEEQVRIRVQRFKDNKVYDYTFIVTDDSLVSLVDVQGYLGMKVRDCINELNDEVGKPRV